MTEDDDILEISDLRAAGICVRGIRAYLRDQGLDFEDFCQNGMPMSRVKDYLPDAFIERGIENMKRRLADGRRGR